VEWGSSGIILKEGKSEGVRRKNSRFQNGSGKVRKTAFRRGGNQKSRS
jgi:hypothetical protein